MSLCMGQLMDAPCVAPSRVTQKIFAVLVEWYPHIVLIMSFKLVSFYIYPYISHLRVGGTSTARKLVPLRNWTGGDWSRCTWGVSGGSSTSDGTTTKFCVALVCWQLRPLFVNDFMLPGLLAMYQQIGSFRPAAKHKTVSGHGPTGGVPEADLLPPGLSRSSETQELRWPTPCGWQKTDRSGDKSQRREATAERLACRKEWRADL